MNVRLLAYTQINDDEGDIDPETLLASEKRICNTNKSFDKILAECSQEWTEKRIGEALRDKHMGLFEHISFTFLIEGISRVATHQLVRHRMASYLQTSQRAVRMDQLKIIVPPSAVYHKDTFMHAQDALRAIYQDLIDAGMKPEDARYIMPHGMETRIIMTINGRSLMHFLRLRLGKHAQWEINGTADQMLTLVRDKFPLIFSKEYMDSWE